MTEFTVIQHYVCMLCMYCVLNDDRHTNTIYHTNKNGYGVHVKPLTRGFYSNDIK